MLENLLVRLTTIEQNAIKEALREQDPEAQIFLFGSRVDDSKRGGDIDLLVLSQKLNSQHREQLRTKICEKIGWQKIDIVIAQDNSTPFVRLALENGVQL